MSLRPARSPAPPKMTMMKGPTRNSGRPLDACVLAMPPPVPASAGHELLLDGGDLPDAPQVPPALEGRPEPHVDDPPGQVPVEGTAAKDEDVGVVVLDAQPGVPDVADEGGPDAGDLVGGDGGPDPGAAGQDAFPAAPAADAQGQLLGEVRIVDAGRAPGADVLDAIAPVEEQPLDEPLDPEAGVIGAEDDPGRVAHSVPAFLSIVASRSSSDRSKARTPSSSSRSQTASIERPSEARAASASRDREASAVRASATRPWSRKASNVFSGVVLTVSRAMSSSTYLMSL